MPTPQPYRLTIANQKGGVGKSTLTLNLAGALNACGYDVLVVDMDPNGHLTVALDHKPRYVDTNSASLYGALADDDVGLEDLVVECQEFDLVPSNIQMFGLERELISMRQGELRLQSVFDNFVATNHDAYDVILVDAPPSLGLLTDNAIVATENIIVPVEADETSTHALDLLLNQVELLEDTYEITVGRQGIVIMNVEHPPDREERTMIEWFEANFGDVVPVYEVRKRVDITRAWNSSVSLFEYDADNDDMEGPLTEIAGDIANDAVEVQYA